MKTDESPCIDPRSGCPPIAIAALSAAAALALFVISPLSPLRDEAGAVYATAPEQERLVRLSDGTTIEMAPGARLRASFEGVRHFG